MTKRRVSLKDIAKHLGISVSTVSRALKDHPDLSADVIVKVKNLARKWNYTANPMAMALLKQETRTIGVIVPDIATHFFSSIISGIEATAKENGYYIVITSSQESCQKEKENIDNLINLRVEGLIACLAQDTQDYAHFDTIIDAEIPLVFFDRVCRIKEFSSVGIDNTEAARELTVHLFENGCRRIAHISGPPNLSITKDRLAGYLKGLEDCGLAFDPSLHVHSTLSIEGAVVATNKLMSLKNPPDAIMGINDTVIFSTLKELKRKGYKIPQDVALVSFTDDYHATEVEPNLTTITHPTFEMGQEAARLLINEIKSITTKSVQQVKLQPKLNVRASSERRNIAKL